MASGAFIVKSYSVIASAFRTGGPQSTAPHRLFLGTDYNPTGIIEARIYFFQERIASYPGYRVKDVTGRLYVFEALTDDMFASWYDILRSERPIAFSWDPDGPVTTQLNFLQINTGFEPVGEGPADMSPNP